MLSFVFRVFVITMVLALALSLAGVFSVVAAQVEPAAEVTLRLGVVPPGQLRFLRGDTITYSACIENPSETNDMVVEAAELTTPDGVVHDLDPPPPDIVLDPNDGAPGGTDEYCWTLDWVVPGDYPRGTAVATLHASGYEAGEFEDPFDASVGKTVFVIIPCIDVEKTPDPEVSKVGDEVTYTITVTNCGEIEQEGLENITVVDSLLGDLSGDFADTLAAGESESHQYTREVLDTDPDPLVNTVEVHSDPAGVLTNDITDTDTAEVDLVHPDIDVTKTADPTTGTVGDTITYTIEVTNTGDIDLENLTVVDSLLGDLSASYADTLADGASESHDFTRDIQPGDPNPLENCVVVHADPLGPLTNDITDEDCAQVEVVQPCIDVEKTADPEVSKAGDDVVYTITVSNCGDTDLENITVVDSLLGDLSGDFADTLAVGASESHDYTREVQPGDPDPLVNTVEVHADPVGPATQDYSDSDTASVDLVHPDITVTKTAHPTTGAVGDTITYTIEVTNSGDIDLENITVDDSLLGDLSGSFADTLAVGASESHDFTRVLLDTDPDPLENCVVVHADPLGPLTNDITDEDCARVRMPVIPSLSQWGIIAMIVVFGGLLLVWTARRRLASRAS